MTEILAVFRSRTQAASCKARLNAMGVAANITATPAELKTGCGLSVSFYARDYNRARAEILRADYTTFSGFARINSGGSYYFNWHT